MDTSPVVWGPCLSDAGLKHWSDGCGLLLTEKLGVLSSLLIVSLYTRGGGYGNFLSQLLLPILM